MDELIKIQVINGQRLIDAEELHFFLDVQSRYNDWIRNRISKYHFIEKQDYYSFTKNLVKPQGGRPKETIGLTFDMAKELCMVENNEKGRKARHYFIQKEKEANEKTLPTNLSRKQIAMMVVEAEERVEKQNQIIATLKPKAEFIIRIMDQKEQLDIGQVAKVLNLPFGRNILYKKLREKGILFKHRNEPMQSYVDRGYFNLVEEYIEKDGKTFINLKVLVTQKGLAFIHGLFPNLHNEQTLMTIF